MNPQFLRYYFVFIPSYDNSSQWRFIIIILLYILWLWDEFSISINSFFFYMRTHTETHAYIPYRLLPNIVSRARNDTSRKSKRKGALCWTLKPIKLIELNRKVLWPYLLIPPGRIKLHSVHMCYRGDHIFSFNHARDKTESENERMLSILTLYVRDITIFNTIFGFHSNWMKL